jgi:hypothetical protein
LGATTPTNSAILQFQSMIITMLLLHIFILKWNKYCSAGQLVPNIGKTADYQLTAKLDENNEISEQELLHTQITVLINGFCLDEFRSKFI